MRRDFTNPAPGKEKDDGGEGRAYRRLAAGRVDLEEAEHGAALRRVQLHRAVGAVGIAIERAWLDTADAAVIAGRISHAATTKMAGPSYRSMKKLRGRIKLRMDNTGGGLTTADGGPLRGFIIAGSDGQFYRAAAEINGKDIIVSSLRAPDPVAVRYCWADFPEGNLVTREGVVASPFRTDDWPGVTVNLR